MGGESKVWSVGGRGICRGREGRGRGEKPPTVQPRGCRGLLGLLAGGTRMRGVLGPRPTDWEMCLTATSCTHTRTRTHEHAHTRAHEHTRAHTVHTRMHAHTQHTHVPHVHAHACTHMHAHTRAHTCTHMHTQTHEHAHTETRRFHCRCQALAPSATFPGVPTEGRGPWGIRVAQPHPQIPTSLAPRAVCLMGA